MRLVLFILSIIIFNSNSFAQTNDIPWFKIYPKVGLQAGGPVYHSSTIADKKGSPGFNPIGGLGLSFKIHKRFHLAFELFYSRRKINYSSNVKDQFYNDQQTLQINNEPITFDIETTFTGKTKGNFDLQFLEIPLLFQYKISNKLLLETGTYYAWAFKRSNKGTASGIVGRTDIDNPNYIENREYDNSNHLNFRYFGIIGGLQYKLCSRANVDFRLTYSFNSLYNEDWKGVDYTLKDLYGQLSVNYVIFSK